MSTNFRTLAGSVSKFSMLNREAFFGGVLSQRAGQRTPVAAQNQLVGTGLFESCALFQFQQLLLTLNETL